MKLWSLPEGFLREARKLPTNFDILLSVTFEFDF